MSPATDRVVCERERGSGDVGGREAAHLWLMRSRNPLIEETRSSFLRPCVSRQRAPTASNNGSDFTARNNVSAPRSQTIIICLAKGGGSPEDGELQMKDGFFLDFYGLCFLCLTSDKCVHNMWQRSQTRTHFGLYVRNVTKIWCSLLYAILH